MAKKALILILILLALMGCGAPKQSVLPASHPDYARLQAIGGAVLPLMDSANIKKYRLVIVDNKTVNASVQDYTIVFTSGAMDYFNDKELTCIFAHEVAHQVLGHYGKRVGISYGVTGIMIVADMIIPGVGLANHIINPVVTKAFSRDQEEDADLYAVRHLTTLCTKQDYIDTLKRTMAHAEQMGYRESGGIFSDHPTFQARIENLK